MWSPKPSCIARQRDIDPIVADILESTIKKSSHPKQCNLIREYNRSATHMDETTMKGITKP